MPGFPSIVGGAGRVQTAPVTRSLPAPLEIATDSDRARAELRAQCASRRLAGRRWRVSTYLSAVGHPGISGFAPRPVCSPTLTRIRGDRCGTRDRRFPASCLHSAGNCLDVVDSIARIASSHKAPSCSTRRALLRSSRCLRRQGGIEQSAPLSPPHRWSERSCSPRHPGMPLRVHAHRLASPGAIRVHVKIVDFAETRIDRGMHHGTRGFGFTAPARSG
jgi:hypothetical protein